MVQADFRAGLGAQWPFLSDERREVIKQINILDETEGEYACVAQPYTFVLRPDLTISKLKESGNRSGDLASGGGDVIVMGAIINEFELNLGKFLLLQVHSGR